MSSVTGFQFRVENILKNCTTHIIVVQFLSIYIYIYFVKKRSKCFKVKAIRFGFSFLSVLTATFIGFSFLANALLFGRYKNTKNISFDIAWRNQVPHHFPEMRTDAGKYRIIVKIR